MGNNANNSMDFRELIKNTPAGVVEASAPCRLDMGGTLDIPTFHFALQDHQPLTVNLALDLRTKVSLMAYTPGYIKVSSRGFESAIFRSDMTPFNHPMGLIFAVAAHFGADGIHIHIDSPSPPRSGLGGSSVAAVALVAAFISLEKKTDHQLSDRHSIAMIAHSIEAAINGVPCGFQDQLAATYGGVHVWHWIMEQGRTGIKRTPLISRGEYPQLATQILVAFTGVIHVSNDINGKWVRQFLDGSHRECWVEIILCVDQFSNALYSGDIPKAVDAINAEVDIRKKLTPEVVSGMGQVLVDAARQEGCGARFTGAGGGGCIWAIGLADRVEGLRQVWQKLMTTQPKAHLMDHGIDERGVVVG